VHTKGYVFAGIPPPGYDSAMKNFVFACTLLSLWMLSGCASNSSNSGNGAGGPVLKSIKVSSSAPSVVAGLTEQLTATASYSDGSTQDVSSSASWSSSNSTVATVSSAGVATGKAAGSTTITATVSGVSGSTSLTVSAAQIKSLSVSAGLYSIAPNTTQAFQATGTFTDGSVQNVTGQVQWTSSNTSVASMNFNGEPGLVEGLAAGTSTITATSGSVSSQATLTVTNATLVSIDVTPGSVAIPLGTVQQFTAKGTFSDNTMQDITDVSAWSSSSPNFLSITASGGLATAKNYTTTSITIYALSQGVQSTATATVNLDDLQSLTVKAATSSIAENTSLQLTATGTFNNGSTRNLNNVVMWGSSDTSVAMVNSYGIYGLVKGLSPSSPSVTITATLGTFAAPFNLTVTSAQVSSISVAPATATIAAGTQLAYTATGTFSDMSVQVITLDVAWSSSNGSATVGPAGVATGVSAGNPTITATLEGIQGSASLTVSSATLESILVSPATAVFAPAATQQYTAQGTYSDGSKQNITSTVTWTSSDSNVAMISPTGLVTGDLEGMAFITAKTTSITSPPAAVVVEGSSLTSVTVTPATGRVAEKTGTQFYAIGTFADGSTEDLTSSAQWSATPGTVATVSSSIPTKGLAMGVAPGTATITALFAGDSGNGTLTVTNATLTSITLTPSDPTISSGSVQFSAQGDFSDGTTENLTSQVNWTSSAVGVATINANGLATATGTGSTTITATLDGVHGQTSLTVQ
jgi:trimeric autotransporter adhesin